MFVRADNARSVNASITDEARSRNNKVSDRLDRRSETPMRTLGNVRAVARGRALAPLMPAMSYMELILTKQCNLQCDYCFETGKNSHKMSDEMACCSVDFLMETARDIQDLTILFFGGEPLLSFDTIRKVVRYANGRAATLGKRIHYDMTTNGTLITEEHLKFFHKHGVKFLLSMDGGKTDHDAHRHYPSGKGSFDIVARKVPLMKRYQPWMGVKMTVAPGQALRLRQNIEELWRLGINQFIVGYAHGMPWERSQLVDYERSLKEVCELYLEMKYHQRPFRMTLFEEGDLGEYSPRSSFGCGAGRGRFCVDSHGDIYGCSKLATIQGMHNGVLPLGNVIQGFTRPDNRAKFLISQAGPRIQCKACELRESCSGGCPAVNFAHTGSIYLPDPLSCRIVFVNEQVHDYMSKRHREIFGCEPGASSRAERRSP